MQWELIEVEPIDCTMDDSGIYTVIHRVVKKETHKEYSGERVLVRVDVLTTDNDPVRSFEGFANDVRKAVIHFLMSHLNVEAMTTDHGYFSREHASYIGWEIARAAADPNYIQD